MFSENIEQQIEHNAQVYSDLYKDLHGFRPGLERFRKLPTSVQRRVIHETSDMLRKQIQEEEEDYPRKGDGWEVIS